MILQATILALLVTVFSVTPARAANPTNCRQSCGTGKSKKSVQYPFGFSAGCPIQLICSAGEMKIGDFQVENISSSGISISLPAQCNRSIESIGQLFGQNYALALRNSLLLQNCNRPLDGCVIATRALESQAVCDSSSKNVSCYSPVNSTTDVLTYGNITSTRCKNVFSSFSWSVDPLLSVDFQRAYLEWWLPGKCNRSSCSANGNCTNVKLGDGRVGFRCWCNEGHMGDGFPDGKGCRKDCSFSNYMSGRCGGATRVGVLVGGLIGGALLVGGLALLCYCGFRHSISLRNQSRKRLIWRAAGNSSVPFYTYKEIEKATNSFSDKQRLGNGAYGTVYAGKLHNDEWVAVKRIRHRDDSVDQVMNEVKLLSAVSHPNLVRLLGCCMEEGEPILVYEFMPNGTLCQHLRRERGVGLPWTIRLTIAAETANGIAHLHSAINPPIYHRDIKSSNILLDYNYKSKVADFGLSRLGIIESSHVSTAPQGTPGYLDPQYHQYFHLSDKSDVYSFGVVLVEIITAMKVVDFSRPHSEVNLAALAIDRIGKGCVDEIIDPYLEPHRDAWTLSTILNVAELAFRCLAFHRDMRPTMMEVAEELEQIRLSAWVTNMYTASPAVSSCSSSGSGSEKSLDVTKVKKAGAAGQKLLVPPKAADSSTSLEEMNDSSPVSVQDPWTSEQNSPSTSSLLDNVVQ